MMIDGQPRRLAVNQQQLLTSRCIEGLTFGDRHFLGGAQGAAFCCLNLFVLFTHKCVEDC